MDLRGECVRPGTWRIAGFEVVRRGPSARNTWWEISAVGGGPVLGTAPTLTAARVWIGDRHGPDVAAGDAADGEAVADGVP